MKNTYDLIVIGSGLGGLTAGAELASRGQRVLVLEQHFQVGGSATSFKRKGFTYEAGLHMTAAIDEESDQYDFFKKCGLLEKLTYVPAPEFYCFKGKGFEFLFGNDVEDNIRRLKEMFPDEARGIDTYFQTIFSVHDKTMELSKLSGLRRLFALLISPLFYPKVLTSMFGNVGNFLDRLFRDERIKEILLANIGYYDDDPYELSLLFYAIAQTGYYRKGGYYIQGGSHRLPYAMAEYITLQGGEVLTSKQATKILVENGLAVGVEYRDSKDTAAEPALSRAYAPVIIANAAIPNVANELLDDGIAPSWKKKINKMKVGPSIMTVYIAMDKPLKAMGNTCYSCNYYDSKNFTLKEMAALHRADFDERPFILCDYSQLDSQLTPEGSGYAVLSLFDYYEDWAGLS
ncbi:MAG: NAD(P)/FAD-dependent oxidoreductase, partial [Candidatus Marinimicrobia bacterium]|nr:NAD(P)/FAD-dependent oxidoreductase [Candidatus Neomarinimicrobiota bacterium]